MPLTEEEREQLRAQAAELGHDAEEFIAAAEEAESQPGKPGAPEPTGPESGAKAHGGRGYFAYEYPFLTVNEVRASLFLGETTDGGMFTGEWLAKHGGPPKPGAPAEDTE